MTYSLIGAVTLSGGSIDELGEWPCGAGVKLHFFGLSNPMPNAFTERLVGTLSYKGLSGDRFLRLADACAIIKEWKKDCYTVRPYGSWRAYPAGVRRDDDRAPTGTDISDGVRSYRNPRR